MDLNQLNEIDFNNIGEWPPFAKAAGIILIIIGVGTAWWYFDTKDQLDDLERTQQKEVTLKRTFEEKQQVAANLDAYREQLEEMKESFGAMLRQLPDKTEVAALLVDVSQTGLAQGLEFELFKPSDEQKREFYVELPINVEVTGRYHDFGRFVSGLAALPRIVTIHNVKIEPKGRGRRSSGTPTTDANLTLKAVVKTYRYLDEE